jgi:hypothetical protein
MRPHLPPRRRAEENGTANRLHAFDNQSAINRASEAVASGFLIARAVIPGAGFVERWKLGDDHTFHLRAFERHLSPVRGEDLDRPTLQRRGGLGPIGF